MHLLHGDDGEHGVLHDFGGEGPPLLLTHGNGLNAAMWTTVLPVLQPHRHCFGLDFRGHGASRVKRPPLDVERSRLVTEVLEATDAIGQGPIDAVGHSLGGATLVRTELENLGTFRRLWLFEPVMVPEEQERPDGDHPLVIAARRRRTDFPSLASFVERLQSKPPFSECEDAAVLGYATLGTKKTPDGISLSCSGEVEAQIFSTGTPTDFETLRSITAPTVVARGEIVGTGNELPPAMAEPIASHLGSGQLLEMKGLTHFGPMEAGQRVGEAVLAHLLA
ncbi:MAG: alpha/beta hydrolase [Actinomycetota bacterium]|nr:alpha/beta hydrolase [Actinomycetota bacterium]